MRLINIDSMKLEEFTGSLPSFPKYYILSHTWGDEEISFQEYTWLQNHDEEVAEGIIDELPPRQHVRVTAKAESLRGRSGYLKIHNFASLARKIRDAPSAVQVRSRWSAELVDVEPANHIWVDTCCINKESSAELSEAINSMYEWYRRAKLCVAFLIDVHDAKIEATSDFAQSRWFTRGWTLQELIAPSDVAFYNSAWEFIGSRSSSVDVITDISKVDRTVISKVEASYMFMRKYPAAAKMSWAAGRKTTRVEDQAYCLMGIFNISMPLLYGEGNNAFYRLQQEIMKTSSDQSLFAWDYGRKAHPWSCEKCFAYTIQCDLFADSPAGFSHCGKIKPVIYYSWEEPAHLKSLNYGADTAYRMTNVGLELSVHLFRPIPGLSRTYAMLPLLTEDGFIICMPVTGPATEAAALEDVPNGARLQRCRFGGPMGIIVSDHAGILSHFLESSKVTRKTVIMEPWKSGHFSASPLWVHLDFNRDLDFLEMFSEFLQPSQISNRGRDGNNTHKLIAFSASTIPSDGSWCSVFLLVREKEKDPMHPREYVVVISLDPLSGCVKWTRTLDWNVVRRVDKPYSNIPLSWMGKPSLQAPSLLGLSLMSSRMADSTAWGPEFASAEAGISISHDATKEEDVACCEVTISAINARSVDSA